MSSPLARGGTSFSLDRVGFLDVGRGLAVLGVLAVHTVQQFPSSIAHLDSLLKLGQFGVQLFFVISAYTMCMTLEARYGEERRPIAAFLVRRFCRLAVPMWVAMALYAGFLLCEVPYYASKSVEWWVVLLNASLLSALSPTAFGASVPGGGSIATEALFYLVFPVIFGLRRSPLAMAVAIAATVIADVWGFRPAVRALAALTGGTDEQTLRQYFHYGLVKQLPVFILGMVLHLLIARNRSISVVEWVVMVLAIAIYFAFSGFIAVVAACCALVLYVLWRSEMVSTSLVWLGRHSYSLYLFHFAFLNILLLAIPTTERVGLFPVCFLVVVGLSAAVSKLTKVYLEDAGTSLGRKLVGRLGLA